MRTQGVHLRVVFEGPTLSSQYDSLGFSVLDDEAFRRPVVARMIEPTSRSDTIRVLELTSSFPGRPSASPSAGKLHRKRTIGARCAAIAPA